MAVDRVDRKDKVDATALVRFANTLTPLFLARSLYIPASVFVPVRPLSVVKNYIALDARLYLQPIAYGIVGGLAAVAFQGTIQLCSRFFWQPLAKVPLPTVAISSFVVVLVASFLAALILKYVSPDAAGSGIPQVKVSFWLDFGFIRLRAALAKFFAGALTIGGGVSLGREGPSVHIAGALASNTAGLFGASDTTPVRILPIQTAPRKRQSWTRLN
jgi:H+/Cl- antiporter ClcA